MLCKWLSWESVTTYICESVSDNDTFWRTLLLLSTQDVLAVISKGVVYSNNLRKGVIVALMNGATVDCELFTDIIVWFWSIHVLRTLPRFKIFLGIDMIERMGAVTVSKDKVCFISSGSCSGIDLSFDQRNWVFKWKWNEQHDYFAAKYEEKDSEFHVLRSKLSQYLPLKFIREEFERKVETWIGNGWLRAYDGPYDVRIPFLGVVNKVEARPVLDSWCGQLVGHLTSAILWQTGWDQHALF